MVDSNVKEATRYIFVRTDVYLDNRKTRTAFLEVLHIASSQYHQVGKYTNLDSQRCNLEAFLGAVGRLERNVLPLANAK